MLVPVQSRFQLLRLQLRLTRGRQGRRGGEGLSGRRRRRGQDRDRDWVGHGSTGHHRSGRSRWRGRASAALALLDGRRRDVDQHRDAFVSVVDDDHIVDHAER